jgi:hypothetical protein
VKESVKWSGVSLLVSKVLKLDKFWGSAVVSRSYEKMVAESGDSSVIQGTGKSAVGRRYRATASEDLTVDTSVCVFVCV